MKTFLIWIGLVCCSVANGLLYHVNQEMEGIVFAMIIPCLVAVYLLYIHRKITKGWTPYPDPWTGGRFPIFSLTLFFSGFALIMMWIISEINPPVMAGLITITVTSAIAFWREKDYTEEN